MPNFRKCTQGASFEECAPLPSEFQSNGHITMELTYPNLATKSVSILLKTIELGRHKINIPFY